ncbi:hypothetical protein GOP47_0026521 [Adiantum capillus-veneris]|nr:hypothetical protein GOP47_0026521 [Adiantum capillus-veneris]
MCVCSTQSRCVSHAPPQRSALPSTHFFRPSAISLSLFPSEIEFPQHSHGKCLHRVSLQVSQVFGTAASSACSMTAGELFYWSNLISSQKDGNKYVFLVQLATNNRES